MEREGFSERHDADFTLVATMDPQEGFSLSAFPRPLRNVRILGKPP